MTKILIVEDENIVAWDIKEALEKLGHTVVGRVVSGGEAIQIAAATSPDLVLMDIRLEGDIDGIAAAQEIYSRFDIPVVYLTAYADDHTLEQATATNPFGYLVKPFQRRELHTTIQVALRRHLLENESNAVKQQLATTLTSIGDATIATDREGFVTFINPVAERLTGWQQQEALGEDVNRVFDLVPLEDREAVENPGIQAMRLGNPVSLPEEGWLLQTKDGSVMLVGDTAAPIKNNEGEIVGSVLVFKDITERQLAQAELQQRNQTLEQFQLRLISQLQERTAQLQQAIGYTHVLSQVLDQVHTASTEYQILQTVIQELGFSLDADYCWLALYDQNDATATITHEYISRDQPEQHSIIGSQINLSLYSQFYRHLLQKQSWICPPEAILPAPYQSLLAPANQMQICPIFVSDGTSQEKNQQMIGEIGILTTGKPLLCQPQTILISQIIGYAVSSCRQAHLQQSNQEFVVELAQLNQLKDDFISSVSHELRTPLTNIRMAVEALRHFAYSLDATRLQPDALQKEQGLRQKLDRLLQILQKEWQRESDLINNLLDFQSSELVFESCSLSGIDFQQWLSQIVKRFVIQADQQGQTLHYRIAPGLPKIVSHFPSLERIVTELLTNACKYTPPNQQITLTAEARGERLELSVANTGIELRSPELEQIFKPFYRIPRSNPWNYNGTGLGLALVKKLVLGLGGEIQAASGSGVTVLRVTLPLSSTKPV